MNLSRQFEEVKAAGQNIERGIRILSDLTSIALHAAPKEDSLMGFRTKYAARDRDHALCLLMLELPQDPRNASLLATVSFNLSKFSR